MKNIEQKMLFNGSEYAEAIDRVESNIDKGKEPLESRPIKPNCAFYVRGGYCRYGDACRFNHPPRETGDSWIASRLCQVGEGVGRMPCQFYLNPAGCWYGNTCKFAHYPERFDMSQTRPSTVGFPIRPEDIECPFYTFLGSCERTDICRFQHPPLPTSQADQSDLLKSLLEKSSSSKYESRALPYGGRSKGLQISNEPVSSSGVSRSQMLLLPQLILLKGDQNPAVSTSSSSKGYMERTAHAPTPTQLYDHISQQANTEELRRSLVRLNRPNTRPTGSPTGSVGPISFPRRPNMVASTSCLSRSYAGLFAHVPTPTMSVGSVSRQLSTDEHSKSRVQFNLPAVSTLSNVRDTPAMTKSDVINNLQANTKERPKSQVRINLPVSSTSSSSKDNIRHTAHAPTTTTSGNAINQQVNTEEHPKSQVRFNHPNVRPIRAPIVAVSPMGLPLRPNQPVCTFYSRFGLCIDGIGCQHDHPVGYGTAAAQSSDQTPGPSDTGNNANQ